MGGGSDDIGDVSWNVPTVTLRFPANMPNLPGHNWANGIADGDAHRAQGRDGRREGAGADDARHPHQGRRSSRQAWDYFHNVQTKDMKYTPIIRPEDKPAIDLNADIMEKYRPEMRKFYYDPTKYQTYLEQLGITYPTVKKEP